MTTRSNPRSKLVAITAASSFSAVWIARALKEEGYEVAGLCSEPKAAYLGLKQARLDVFSRYGTVHYGLVAERGDFARWVQENQPAIWIHHHHFMEKFRRPDYDVARADAVGIPPLGGLVRALKAVPAKGIIYSGTAIEPEESGATGTPTPYALSKQRVWHELQKLSAPELTLSKVIIPNPVGPLENDDRLIPQMIRIAQASSAADAVLKVEAPQATMHNLSVADLARGYIQAARDFDRGGTQVVRPTGVVCSVREWVEFVNEMLLVRAMALPPCPVTWGNSAAANPAPPSAGTENLRRAFPAEFWAEYAAILPKH
ncbi:MAG: NAD-dependent epimerase/dehydratase family protein [Bacteriovoracia bacterium]